MQKLTSTLLVDDDETTNFVNEMLLKDMGVTEQILTAHNGQEALELILERCENNECPSLILLDINMPVMNGFEFLERYRKLDFPDKHTVVIGMLTTSLNPRDMDQLVGLPYDDFLSKPLTEAKVRSLLDQHFSLEL